MCFILNGIFQWLAETANLIFLSGRWPVSTGFANFCALIKDGSTIRKYDMPQFLRRAVRLFCIGTGTYAVCICLPNVLCATCGRQ